MQANRQPSTGRKTRARYGVMSMGVLVLCLLGALGVEYRLRQAPQDLGPQWQIRELSLLMKHDVVPDSDMGFVLVPNQHRWIQTPDFNYLRRTDTHGFVNPEPWPATADIIFLGDSLVTGEGVGLDGQFVRLIANRLPTLQLLNLALPGAGAERQYHIYRRLGAPLQPRLVVACLYLASDLENDVHFHAWRRDPQGMDFNRFRLTYQRRHDPRPAYHPMRLLERSRLYALGQNLVASWFHDAHTVPERYTFADGTEILLDRRQIPFHTQPIDATDPRLTQLFGSLLQLREAAARDQAKLLVVLIPSKEELFGPQPTSPQHTAMAHIRRQLENRGYAVLDLYPVLQKHGRQQSPYFSRDIHLNRSGNEAVAAAFTDWWQRHMSTP